MDDTTKRTALRRVHTLFHMATETFPRDPALAQRYVRTARKIAMAARIRLPTEYRRRICRRCKTYISPGINCRVRIKQQREPHVVITCLNCGQQMRINLKKKEPKTER